MNGQALLSPLSGRAGLWPEPDSETTTGSRATATEHADNGSVRYALEGAVVWAALAFSRALVDERHGPGDPRYDRLLDIQRELTELRDDWERTPTRVAAAA